MSRKLFLTAAVVLLLVLLVLTIALLVVLVYARRSAEAEVKAQAAPPSASALEPASHEAPPPPGPDPKPRRRRGKQKGAPALAAALPAAPMASRKLLVCSIGNPGSTYANTRHSAGHTLLELVRAALMYPPFARDRTFGGAVSTAAFAAPYTLFQSPSLMNVSGKPVLAAWRAFLRALPADERAAARLVVLHDELEKPLGRLKVKTTGSAGGHNGLTDIIRVGGTKEFWRIGVGIGRPESREPRVVAGYVLSRFTSYEREQLERNSLPLVLDALRRAEREP